MDVISLGKAKKVGKLNKSLQGRLGQGVKGSVVDVAARVSAIEDLDPKAGLVKRIGDVSKHTAVNINKHNLRMQMRLDMAKSKLKDSVVDIFKDASGIDMGRSSGIFHDPAEKTIKLLEGVTSGELVLTPEQSEEVPILATVTLISAGAPSEKEGVPLTGGVTTDVELKEASLELIASEGIVPKEGTFESSVIDLGDNFKELNRIEVSAIETGTSSVEWYTASSNDGSVFEEYLPINTDGTIASTSQRYVKVKAILKADGILEERVIHDFSAEEASQFEANEYVIFDGALKLKTQYEQEMVVDETYTGEGTLLKAVIDKSKFKSIESMEVN